MTTVRLGMKVRFADLDSQVQATISVINHSYKETCVLGGADGSESCDFINDCSVDLVCDRPVQLDTDHIFYDGSDTRKPGTFHWLWREYARQRWHPT
jgi:hypothetical protein